MPPRRSSRATPLAIGLTVLLTVVAVILVARTMRPRQPDHLAARRAAASLPEAPHQVPRLGADASPPAFGDFQPGHAAPRSSDPGAMTPARPSSPPPRETGLPTETGIPPESEPGASERVSITDAASAVVAIEGGRSPRLRVLGSGFLVDIGRPIVVTSLHVTRTLVTGQVRLENGTRYEIAGYAAVEPEADLAVLELVAVPPTVPTIGLAERSPLPRDRVWSLGHPERRDGAVLPGHVVGLVASTHLPPDSEQYARRILGATAVTEWVQHDTALAPGSSGGPLLDQAGRVVAINAFVDPGRKLAYAVPVGVVRTLLAHVQRQPGRVQPLARYVLPQDQAGRQEAMSVERIDALRHDLEAVGWTPTDEAQYRAFCDLATWVTAAAVAPDAIGAGGQMEAAERTALLDAIDRVDQALRTRRWDIDQIAPINEWAALRWGEGDRGWVFFGTIARVVRGDRAQKGAFMTLTGGGPTVFVRLDHILETPEPGTHYLLVGWQIADDHVRYGDNPLRPKMAPEILAGALIAWQP